MILRQGVSLVTGLCLLAGCATTYSAATLDNWKARRDAFLREAVAYQGEIRMYNEEVQSFNRAWKQLEEHEDFPAVQAFLHSWETTYKEQGKDAAALLWQRLTDAQYALVAKLAALAPQAPDLESRKSSLDAQRDSLQAEYYRLDSDLKLYVAGQQEVAASQERHGQSLQTLGLSILLMGQSLPRPLPPIHCTTTYMGQLASTNCR